MRLTIENALPILTADALIAGAAVKVLMAGGSELTDDRAYIAAQLSPYLWTRHASAVMDLVGRLEARQAA